MSPARRLVGLLLAVLFLVVGCGASKKATTSDRTASSGQTAKGLQTAVPRPDFARFLPANYRVRRVWYEQLSNPKIPDAVVTSVGPPVGSLNFHSADLQVLSYDAIAKRWIDAFDAQRVTPPDAFFSDPADTNFPIFASSPAAAAPTTTTPLIDPTAEASVPQVAFVQFARDQGRDLVFTSTSYYGGSGTGSELTVVSFQSQEASIAYRWSGEGLYAFRVERSAPRQRLLERASYWTTEDPHCCPLRTYQFTVSATGSGRNTYVTATQDQRPWLGVYAQGLTQNDQNAPIEVVGVVPGSPAQHAGFERGDVILSIPAAHKLANQSLLGPALVDQFSLFNAGDQVSFVVRRGSQTLTLNVRLGSLIDSSALGASPPAGAYSVATI